MDIQLGGAYIINTLSDLVGGKLVLESGYCRQFLFDAACTIASPNSGKNRFGRPRCDRACLRGKQKLNTAPGVSSLWVSSPTPGVEHLSAASSLGRVDHLRSMQKHSTANLALKKANVLYQEVAP
mmetsp:Transcript_22471/g.27703  ORF Transcript_22471/g.27703 Transcript_22471/m.27703 type:complete len:125 (-) Transcript_22471:186-560(-)